MFVCHEERDSILAYDITLRICQFVTIVHMSASFKIDERKIFYLI